MVGIEPVWRSHVPRSFLLSFLFFSPFGLSSDSFFLQGLFSFSTVSLLFLFIVFSFSFFLCLSVYYHHSLSRHFSFPSLQLPLRSPAIPHIVRSFFVFVRDPGYCSPNNCRVRFQVSNDDRRPLKYVKRMLKWHPTRSLAPFERTRILKNRKHPMGWFLKGPHISEKNNDLFLVCETGSASMKYFHSIIWYVLSNNSNGCLYWYKKVNCGHLIYRSSSLIVVWFFI